MKYYRRTIEWSSRFRRIIRNNYFFILWLILEAIFCALFNFRSNAQSGLIQTYLQYANFIRSGFNLSVEPYLYTFPIWGYGFVLSLTKSKVIIIIVQQLLAISTVVLIDNTLRYLRWRTLSIVLFRLSSLIALPWFFFHTVIWPYSWGANLLMFAILFLFRYLDSNRIIWIVMSALCLGIMLNFRSDYLFFVIFLTLIIPIIQWKSFGRLEYVHILVWSFIIISLLLPWSQYSKIKSGHRLFTTTNKGHFLFISLGQLPDNPWNITPLDKDSLMAKIVKDSLGQKGTITYQADTLLTKMWISFVKENPRAFAQKCLVNFNTLNDFPFYHGELWVHKDLIWEDSLMQTQLDIKVRNYSHLLNIKTNDNGWIKPIGSLLFYQSRVIAILSYLALILYFLRIKVFYKDSLAFIMLSMIAYQAAISILTFYTKEHNTNLYFIYILWVIYIFVERRSIPTEPIDRCYYKLKKLISTKNVKVNDNN